MDDISYIHYHSPALVFALSSTSYSLITWKLYSSQISTDSANLKVKPIAEAETDVAKLFGSVLSYQCNATYTIGDRR